MRQRGVRTVGTAGVTKLAVMSNPALQDSNQSDLTKRERTAAVNDQEHARDPKC